MKLKQPFQTQLEDAFEMSYPQLVEFKDLNDEIKRMYINQFSEFREGFIAGLEAAGVKDVDEDN